MIHRIYLILVLYVICVLLLFVFKPAMLFDASGNLKHFNYDERDTKASLMNIEVVLFILAILCYFAVLVLELILY